MSKIDIYETLEIQKVIDFLTTEKDILSIVDNTGTLTINVNSTLLLGSIYLTDGLYVKINNVNYKVQNVTSNSFDIESSLIVATKWSLAFEYKYGSRIEVNELLNLATTDPDNNQSRFPLLWLIIDSDNRRDFNFSNPIDFKSNLKFAMINLTEKTYRTSQRETYNFIPTLQPYVRLFLETLTSSYFGKVFLFEDKRILNYSDYYRYFYGSADKNAQVFDAPTDAIEFEIELAFKEQFC